MKIKPTIILIFLSLALTGCSSILSDVERLSGALMLNERGHLNIDSYNLILNKKFPDGTPTKDVITYIKQQNGNCTQQGDGYFCRIAYHATICWIKRVDIKFTELPELKTIYGLHAIESSDGC